MGGGERERDGERVGDREREREREMQRERERGVHTHAHTDTRVRAHTQTHPMQELCVGCGGVAYIAHRKRNWRVEKRLFTKLLRRHGMQASALSCPLILTQDQAVWPGGLARRFDQAV